MSFLSLWIRYIHCCTSFLSFSAQVVPSLHKEIIQWLSRWLMLTLANCKSRSKRLPDCWCFHYKDLIFLYGPSSVSAWLSNKLYITAPLPPPPLAVMQLKTKLQPIPWGEKYVCWYNLVQPKLCCGLISRWGDKQEKEDSHLTNHQTSGDSRDS